MTKYKDYVQKMLDDNSKVFEKFKALHDEYALNQDGLQDKFNKEGEAILEIVREYENRLCTNTERGMYNKFSGNLAEKFQNEVRRHFPMIDYIGLKVEKPTDSNGQYQEVEIEKISLNSGLQTEESFTIKRIKLQ
jgi:sugar-specific transcriptional regulator TrmB